MTVNGRSKDIEKDDLLASGKTMMLNTRFCKEVIADTEKVVSEWPGYAERCGIDPKTVRSIDSILVRRS